MILRMFHHISRLDHKNTTKATDDKIASPEYDSDAENDERYLAVGAGRANVVSSRLDALPNFTDDPGEARARSEDDVMHAPVLDIDFQVFVIPSSSRGHFHLYIEKPVPWSAYKKLLVALAECGIIQEGYADASIDRGATYVRMPWVTKPTAVTTGEEPF